MKVVAIIILLICSKIVYCQQDTIPVIMLYSDTAITDLYGVDDFGDPFTELGDDEYSYWKRGYLVRKFIPTHWENGDILVMSYWEDAYYLDIYKVPLPVTNVVWFYKTLK